MGKGRSITHCSHPGNSHLSVVTSITYFFRLFHMFSKSLDVGPRFSRAFDFVWPSVRPSRGSCELSPGYIMEKHMGGSINGSIPKWLVYFMENSIYKLMIWGYTYFRKPLYRFQDLHSKVIFNVIPRFLFP